MANKWDELKRRSQEIEQIKGSIALLGWDQNTYMPVSAAAARGRQLATLGRILHERLTDPLLRKLLEDLKAEAKEYPYESFEASLYRVVKREIDQAIYVPSEFMARFYEHTAKTHQAWVEARENDDFEHVRPYLEKTLELSQEYANYFPGYEHILDPLIDRLDYGVKANVLKKLFSELRSQLVPMVEEVSSRAQTSAACLQQHFSKEKQLTFVKQLIEEIGYDFSRGRMDFAPHPFMTKFSHHDVRITTRVKENDLSEVLFSTIHETGHALYELGIHSELEETGLDNGTSSGVHESQSRLWENIVGRSKEFWTYFYPKLVEMFPSQLGNVSLDEFVGAINRVEKSLIRTDADELTYNLHVIIRFDLEMELLEGKLAVKDLPEAWKSRYQSDLHITPPNDKDGVLQDIHWYMDFIGGMFQCYTLGNILSAQFYETALQAHPQIPEEISQGKFDTLHGWLKENIYRHGSKLTADELVEKVTGKAMTTEPYIQYLKNKFQV